MVKTLEIEVDKRCRVATDGNERRGLVKFVGFVPEINKSADMCAEDDIWVGIEFDEPVGKNNGSLKGVKYFEAKPKHGSFLRPDNVEVGDYPELDLFDDLDDDDEI